MIYNLGSINVDHVYRVHQLAQPGETISSLSYQQFLGGKGCNQSIALIRAQCDICHIGAIAENDKNILQLLDAAGIDVHKHAITFSSQPTGHACIQVEDSGENSIVLFAGANNSITAEYVEQILANANQNDWLLCQNETSAIAESIAIAKKKNMKIMVNPAPFNSRVNELIFDDIDFFMLNEHELFQMGGQSNIEANIQFILANWPKLTLVITLGKHGSILVNKQQRLLQGIFDVDVVDTTGAGDTFVSYFLASCIADNNDYTKALYQAAAASALSVTTEGAAESIPTLAMLESFLQHMNEHDT